MIERDSALDLSRRRGTLEAYRTAENFLARTAGYGITLRQEHEIRETVKSIFAAQPLHDMAMVAIDKTVLDGLAIAPGEESLHQLRRGFHEFCAYNDDIAVVARALAHER